MSAPSPSPSVAAAAPASSEGPPSGPAEPPSSLESATPDPTPATDAATPEGEAAPDVLATLDVKGRAPKTGYSRDQFGPAWADADRNGCDTRNDILARDLSGVTFTPGTHDCVVLTGTLEDPYTGAEIAFQRGQATSSAVQIDHVVALSDAWQKGAQQWDAATRERFANDPANLLAVGGSANEQKSDGDAATWLPANKAFRCEYVARQIGVKARYGLWVTHAEKGAMTRVLSSCPDQAVPGDAAPVAVEPAAGSDSGTVATPGQVAPAAGSGTGSDTGADTGSGSADVYYTNCAAAWAAGAAPLRQGDPGYRAKLDGDHDGVACEHRP